MPNAWVGIYPFADSSWKGTMKGIFKNNAVTDFALVALKLTVSETKQFVKVSEFERNDLSAPFVKVSESPDLQAQNRLEHQYHASVPDKETAPLDDVLKSGGPLNILWLSHAAYCGHTSEKFLPHHDTKAPSHFMSAKAAAKCIYKVCTPSDGITPLRFPVALFVLSCHSGNARRQVRTDTYQEKEDSKTKTTVKYIESVSDDPLAVRVVYHLKRLYDASHVATGKCRVVAPLEAMSGSEMRLMKFATRDTTRFLDTEV